MENQLINFCDFVRQLLQRDVNYELDIQKGRKFVKLLMVRPGGGRSVWCFVDKTTGEIFKPASFNAPAKHPRGNINDPDSYKGFTWTGPPYLR